MKTRFLFSNKLRPLGWLLLIPGIILGILNLEYKYEIPGFELHLRARSYIDRAANENFTNELAIALVVLGGLFVAFSKLKREDELTARMRLNALYWSILINYAIFTFIMLVGLVNENVKDGLIQKIAAPVVDHDVLSYFLFTPLVIFIARFYYLLNKSRNEYAIASVHFLPYRPFNPIAKNLSLILFLPAVYLVAGYGFFAESWTGIAYLVVPLLMMVWIYSKEKQEDEYISSIRLDAMQIAVYANFSILFISNIFCYGFEFLYIQFVNPITIPLIFIVVFQYRLYRLSKNTDRTKSKLNISVL